MAKRKVTGVSFKAPPGHYISGIPRRNLTPEEWDRLPASKQKRALESGLYKIKTSGVKAPEPEKTEGEA